MKCRHGITGPCPRCQGEEFRREALLEIGRLVVALAENNGLDTSRLEFLLRKLP